jgi:hypothetical protein
MPHCTDSMTNHNCELCVIWISFNIVVWQWYVNCDEIWRCSINTKWNIQNGFFYLKKCIISGNFKSYQRQEFPLKRLYPSTWQLCHTNLHSHRCHNLCHEKLVMSWSHRGKDTSNTCLYSLSGNRLVYLSCLVCNCCWLTMCIFVVVLCVLLSYVYLLYYKCVLLFLL